MTTKHKKMHALLQAAFDEKIIIQLKHKVVDDPSEFSVGWFFDYVRHIKKSQKDLDNCVKVISTSLQSDDRRKRKRILEDLRKELSDYNKGNPKLVTYFDAIRFSVWSAMNDTAEAVRDVSLDLVAEVLSKVPCNNKYLEELMPIVLNRLDDHKNREPAEELRLKLVELLDSLITNYDVEIYVGEIITTLAYTLTDKYAKVRQGCAKCCLSLAPEGGQVLYENACKLVKPILSSFKHNHSRTRINALEALEAILREANWKNIDAQLVFGSLGERIFDDSVGVKLALVNLLGNWLVHLRDRYSFFNRLVPLILSCLVDPHPVVSDKAWTVWSAAGRQYVSENEQDLKDSMDYLDEKPQHYPPKIERPNFGCRTLVQRNMYQICVPLTKELTDWQPDVCEKASALLSLLVLHAETDLTQHIANILEAMYKVAENKGNIVPPQSRFNIEKAAEYMGYFISPSSWHKIVYPVVESDPSPGNLYVLAALLRGSSQNSLLPFSDKLAEILATSDIRTSMKEKMHLETLKCCRALLDNIDTVTESATKNLLKCLCNVTAIAISREESLTLARAGEGCLEQLAEKSGVHADKLIKDNILLLLENMTASVDAWCVAHSDFWLFTYILSKPGFLWYGAKDVIYQILRAAMDLDRGDVEVKGRLLACLAEIFEHLDDNELNPIDIEEYTITVVNDIIVPNLTWRAGLSAEKLRSLVLVCLLAITKRANLPKSFPTRQLIPLLTGALKDNHCVSRLLALEILQHIIHLEARFTTFDSSLVEDVYPNVLGRLDDIDESIRKSATSTLCVLFTKMADISYTEKAHASIIGHIVKTMLVYLDDDIEVFRQSVHDALKIMIPLAPTAIRDKIMERQHLMKYKDLCSELLELANHHGS